MRQRRGVPPGGSGGAPNAVSGLLLQALQHHRAGDLAGAAASCQRVLECAPEQPDALHLLGVLHHQSGEHGKAAELIGRSVRRNPRNAEAHSNLGAALSAAGDLDGAAKSFQRAIKLDPRSAGAYANLAALSVRRGADEDAIRNFRAAHRLSPREPRFIRRLAELYLKHEQFGEAADWFGRYLAFAPDDAEAHNNAAFALQRLDRIEDAEAEYRRAMALQPDKPEIGNNLASILQRLGRTEEADEIFARVLAADPRQWEDLSHYAGALFNNGSAEKALALYETLTLERPDDAELHRAFGTALVHTGRTDEAVPVLRRALRLEPDRDEVRISLAHCLLRVRKIDEAIDALTSVRPSSSGYLDALLDLCLVYSGAGRLEEACAAARAAAAHPDFTSSMFVKPYTVYRSACAFDDLEALPASMAEVRDEDLATWAGLFVELLAHADTPDRIGDLVALHRRWGDAAVKAAAADPLPPFDASPRNGPIRVGIVSSDLRRHSVARFVMPLISHYDRDRFEIYCYSPEEDSGDEIQDRIRRMIAAFRVTGSMGYRDTAELIRRDNIDILFELNGFTADSRLNVMAFRPAPVQIFWLGYPGTTGMAAMDYILLDEHNCPVCPDWLVEEPLLIPGSWVCYESFEQVPVAATPPADRNGVITFGTLNSPYKFTRASVALWADVMRQVADSRFLFVHPSYRSTVVSENLAREFESRGIAGDRLTFVNNRDSALSHFSYYEEIDISLDTVPLTGGTTTADALWSGVPVVSLVGPAMHQRISYSMLMNAGAGELCATSPGEYVKNAVSLAGDRSALRRYRRELRDAVRGSALGDARLFTRNLQQLLFGLVERHRLR